ncbi:UDP-forming cellulose synthase catalytic subunit [Burkholderiaceae bacterium DAT-1]|nr:UDP-forming cellulose synthase catalytic subunit [Burkholderiaceae bacterium DAT-1]
MRVPNFLRRAEIKVVQMLARHPEALPVLWGSVLAMVLWLAWLPVESSTQLLIAYGIVALLLVLRRFPHFESLRIFFLVLAGFVTMRYFFWRTMNTLGYNDLASWCAAVTLYIAEAYGITVSLLGIFVNIRPLIRKPVPLPSDQALWPSVDVYIPSYNEPEDLLEITTAAAMHIRYPREKLRVYLLDDGGTVQKRNDSNPEKAAEAQARFESLQRLCERYGAHYLTRERNQHAKAGNLNAALPKTHGDLILILDADHVPTIDILEKTVGTFVDNEKMFLVQTPHFFINPDPVEKNLQVFGQIPSENEMFYSVIQHGLDFWGASFFCGSAAVLRRKYLMEVGGISGSSITEDAETALSLHCKGYESAYIGHPMISGLQPETFSGFVVQRVRWAQGMVQIFLLSNPLRQKGLKLWQRLCYFSSSFFWFFSYARVVFLLAPSAFLVFGMQIYNATLTQFVAYALPHVVAVTLVSDYLFGKVRWAFISELYELMQSLYALPGIITVFRNPRAPQFKVTPKGEHLDEDFISQLSGPFYVIYLLQWVSIAFGIWRYFDQPLTRDVTVITLGWAIFNLLLLHAAIGALFERKQRRAVPRMPADMPATILVPQHDEVPARIVDLSTSGAQMIVDRAVMDRVDQVLGGHAILAVRNPATRQEAHLSVDLRNRRPIDAHQDVIGVAFSGKTPEQITQMVLLAHGDSQRWKEYRDSRPGQESVFHSLFVLIRIGFVHSFVHWNSILVIAYEWLSDTAHSMSAGPRERYRRWKSDISGWLRKLV